MFRKIYIPVQLICITKTRNGNLVALGTKLISDNCYVSDPEWFLFLYFKYWYFRSLKLSYINIRAFIWTGCHRNSTSTLYSAAGYFLCIKDKKKMHNPIIIWVCCIVGFLTVDIFRLSVFSYMPLNVCWFSELSFILGTPSMRYEYHLD
jgi:hypothetical protein